MSGVVVTCCRAAIASPTTSPAIRPIARTREITFRLVTGKGEGVARVVAGVVRRVGMGKTDEIDEAQAQNQRDEGRLENLRAIGGKGERTRGREAVLVHDRLQGPPHRRLAFQRGRQVSWLPGRWIAPPSRSRVGSVADGAASPVTVAGAAAAFEENPSPRSLFTSCEEPSHSVIFRMICAVKRRAERK